MKTPVFRALLACLTCVCAPASAQAPWQPDKPVEFVVGSGPGGGNDVMGRALIAAIDDAKLSPVRIQISNKVGGGGAEFHAALRAA